MHQSEIFNIKPLGFQWEALDPFLFCVHHEDFFPKGNANLGPGKSELAGRNIGQDFQVKDGWRMYHGQDVPGFPPHPHRGFETITVVRKGWVDHSDSMGAAGRYGNGDVQWMTAGKGLQHSEMFPLVNQDTENPMELFQIWLNLPRVSKMVEPHYKMFWNEDIPRYETVDGQSRKTKIELIAGNTDNLKAPLPPPDSWAAKEENEVAIWVIHMEPNAIFQIPVASPEVNRRLYFYKGDRLRLDDTNLPAYHSADLMAGRQVRLIAGEEACSALILQGRPMHEPVVQYGPFVMNTQQEIRDAYSEYRQTQFGGWPWPYDEVTHGADAKRFALYSDGTKEER
ncbi:MAG: pirin family protein [Bacteroidales bacterium]|nr:pirin family protein [Bacteroidales bacterium]